MNNLRWTDQNGFYAMHPTVNFIYFTAVIGFSMCFMNPLCLAISITASFVQSVLAKRNTACKFNLRFMISAVCVAAIFNALFNHRGGTVLAYFPGGNPLTLESILFGIASGVMLCSIICWFSVFGEIITDDKITYLFAKTIPSLSVVISMAFRLVPEMKRKTKEMIRAQKCLGNDIAEGNVFEKAKGAITIFSALVTRVSEESVQTADSMKCRGFGKGARTSYSIFIFGKRDATALAVVVVLAGYVLVGAAMGNMSFEYFPRVSGKHCGMYEISVYAAFGALCFLPIVTEVAEVIKWKYIISKI